MTISIRNCVLLLVVLSIVVIAAADRCLAQLIAAESFNTAEYGSPGGLGGLDPNDSAESFGWSGAWNSGSANIQSETITLENAATLYDDTSDGKGRFIPVGPGGVDFRKADRTLDPSYTKADTYYMSFFVNGGGSFSLAGADKSYATVGFGNFFDTAAYRNDPNSSNVFGLHVGFRGEDAGSDPNTVDLVMRARDVATGDLVDTVLLADAGNEPFGATYNVVLKVDVNDGGGTADPVTYWVNPGDLSSEAAATSSTALTGTVQTAALDTNAAIDRLSVTVDRWSNRLFFWDETRFGYDFASVAGPQPAPEDPDFNGNDLIDAPDFLIWQRNAGLTGATQPQGDANGDGNVDGLDLAIWELQYGTAQSVSAVTAVPEPGTAILLAMCGLMAVVRRSNRS